MQRYFIHGGIWYVNVMFQGALRFYILGWFGGWGARFVDNIRGIGGRRSLAALVNVLGVILDQDVLAAIDNVPG